MGISSAVLAFLLAAEASPPTIAVPSPTPDPCGGPRGISYVWGPDGALRVSGRLAGLCPEFKIIAKNLDSGEAVTIQPTAEETFEGSMSVMRFSSLIARWKQPQAELAFEGAGETKGVCVATRQSDLTPRWLCDRPAGAEALGAFWVEKLGLKGSVVDEGKNDAALGDLWVGNLSWRVDDDGLLALRGSVVGEGKNLPPYALVQLSLGLAAGQPPLAGEVFVALEGSASRMAGDFEIGIPIPLWSLGKPLRAVLVIDPENQVPESSEKNNATVAQMIRPQAGVGPFLLAPGITGGPKAGRFKKISDTGNLSLAELQLAREPGKARVSGLLSVEESPSQAKAGLRRWISVTGYLGSAGKAVQVRTLKIPTDGGGAFTLLFDRAGGSDSASLALVADPEDRYPETNEDDNLAACSLILAGDSAKAEPLCPGSSLSPFGFLLQPGFQSPELLGDSPGFTAGGAQGDLRLIKPGVQTGGGGHVRPDAVLVREPPADESSGGTVTAYVSVKLRAGSSILAEDKVAVPLPRGTVGMVRFWSDLFAQNSSGDGERLVEMTVDPDKERAEDDEANNTIEIAIP